MSKVNINQGDEWEKLQQSVSSMHNEVTKTITKPFENIMQ